MKVDRLHLIGVGGSNKVMGGELSRLARRAFDRDQAEALLSVPPAKDGPGGLLYPFAPELAALAVNYHRTSARVLWDLYESAATRLEPLYEELYEDVRLDDREWCFDGAKISVLAFDSHSVEAGERQVVGTVKNALLAGATRRGITLEVDAERPDITIHARSSAETGRLSVSIDLAGRPMHQRGYRTKAGEAPLREDVAAMLVMLARHDPRSEAFIDPMAGSGTLLAEAEGLAKARPVWTSGRRAAAEAIPALQDDLPARPKPLFADTEPALFAAEIDEATQDVLRRTLSTAGIEPATEVFAGDFRRWDPAELQEAVRRRGFERGLVLCNPPYGERLKIPERQLLGLYRDLGRWCRSLTGYRAAFIAAHPGFERAFGGRPRVKKPIRNGPLRAQFLLYDS